MILCILLSKQGWYCCRLCKSNECINVKMKIKWVLFYFSNNDCKCYIHNIFSVEIKLHVPMFVWLLNLISTHSHREQIFSKKSIILVFQIKFVERRSTMVSKHALEQLYSRLNRWWRSIYRRRSTKLTMFTTIYRKRKYVGIWYLEVECKVP